MSAEAGSSPLEPSLPLALLDKALALQTPLTGRHVARLRRNRPDATPRQIVVRLNAELRAATISTGAGVGAAAAAPGVGTGAALAISGAEAVAFLNATVLYILARGEVQGITIEDVERRRTLVMAVMLGDAGAKGIGAVAERTGQHWARQLVRGIPMAKVDAINKVLGRHFVTKYGTKQGIVVLSRVIPFGIGAVIGGTANAVFSQGIITASNRAFGAPSRSSEDWLTDSTGTPLAAEGRLAEPGSTPANRRHELGPLDDSNVSNNVSNEPRRTDPDEVGRTSGEKGADLHEHGRRRTRSDQPGPGSLDS